jgi:hypothetical protein
MTNQGLGCSQCNGLGFRLNLRPKCTKGDAKAVGKALSLGAGVRLLNRKLRTLLLEGMLIDGGSGTGIARYGFTIVVVGLGLLVGSKI